jgi:anti-anti-sigma regulatory factor
VVEDVLVITILSSLLDTEANVCPIRNELSILLDRRLPQHHVMNLECVTHLSERAVDVLLGFAQRVRLAGGAMRACQIRSGATSKDILDRLGLMYEIVPTLHETLLRSW